MSQGKAWVTLITSSDYVPGLLTLHRTLVAVSSYPLVVAATNRLPESSRHIIQHAGLTIVEVDHLEPAIGRHAGFDQRFTRFQDTWTKLQVFGLVDYERVILIDSDMIFLRSMDELFEMALQGRDWIAAAPACVCNPLKLVSYPEDWIPANCAWSKQDRFASLYSPPMPAENGSRTSHLLNSGLVVLHPSQAAMDSIVHFINTSPTIGSVKHPDQDVLAQLFHGRWRPLPWWTNALKPARAVHSDVWADTEVRLIHYILDKPWKKKPAILNTAPTKESPILPPTPVSPPTSKPTRSLPPGLAELVQNSPKQENVTNYDAVHAWWWIAYDDMLADMKEKGDSSGWREIEQTVRES